MVTVIAAGGQVYDRTTGTWVGETQGSVGDGVDRSVDASRVKIWHGTDGPVGVQLLTPTPGGVANPGVSTGGGGGGVGPGSAAVATEKGGGGAGPGSAAVMTGPLEPKMQKTTTKLMVGTDQWDANPYWSNADQWEERYGEPGDWLGGVAVAASDVVWNAGKVLSPYWQAFQEDRLFAPGWGGLVDLEAPRPGTYDGAQTIWRTGGGF